MPYKYKILIVIAPLVLLLDQWTKWLVLQKLTIGQTIVVIPNFFDLVHVRNAGAAFGMFANLPLEFRTPFFYAVSLLAVGLLVYFFRTLQSVDRFYPIPLSLITAGALGNLIDRLCFGNVVDFVSLHIQEFHWPAFNIADSAITISMFLLLFPILKRK